MPHFSFLPRLYKVLLGLIRVEVAAGHSNGSFDLQDILGVQICCHQLPCLLAHGILTPVPQAF